MTTVPERREEIKPDVKPEVQRENPRAKSTINLKTAFGNNGKSEEKKSDIKSEPPIADQSFSESQLRQAWDEFAMLRKHQIAEYNLLKRDFAVNGAVITVKLSNSFEEPLLQTMRVQLIAHLRNRLNNNSISISSTLLETEGKKIAYTGKEKFDLLAEKNPALRELKERFGLDPDF